MPQERLSLDSLRELDFGIVAEAFDRELNHVVKDLQDRPTDGKARKVSINFCIKSVDDHADEVEVECEVESTVPKRVSKPYRMRAKSSGDLLFQPQSAEDPDQLDLETERRRADRGVSDAPGRIERARD